MIRPVGIETEYGLNCEGFSEEIDFGYEASMLVRAARVEGAFRGWDYSREDPYWDLRGIRAERLERDPHDLRNSTSKSSKMSAEELLANTVLPSGARYYNDHNHPEFCTDVCVSLKDLVAQDKAGERLLLACQQARNGSATDGKVLVVKNNTDYHGRSYGTHENYLVPRAVPFQKLVDGMIPYLVARQVLVGAGKVGCEGKVAGAAEFQLSQRGDFFEEKVGINTTARRPIFNTRDEPHADKKQYRRLHVIAGDANRSEYATALKAGMSGLVLDRLVADEDFGIRLRDPVRAVREFSRDPDLRATAELDSGEAVSAPDIMERYLETLEAQGVEGAERGWVLGQWRELLDLLRSDPAAAGDRLDWVAKRNLLDSPGGAAELDLASRRKIDLAYHLVDPEMSLYDSLVESGRMRTLVSESRIGAATQTPPSGTRGTVRGLILRRFGSHVRNMEWDSVTLELDGRTIEVKMEAVAGDVIDRLTEVFAEAATLAEAVARLESGRN